MFLEESWGKSDFLTISMGIQYISPLPDDLLLDFFSSVEDVNSTLDEVSTFTIFFSCLRASTKSEVALSISSCNADPLSKTFCAFSLAFCKRSRDSGVLSLIVEGSDAKINCCSSVSASVISTGLTTVTIEVLVKFEAV